MANFWWKFTYLWDEDEGKDTSGGCGYPKPIHCSVYINIVTKHKGHHCNSKCDDSSDIKDGRDLPRVVQTLDLDFPDVESQEGSNGLQDQLVADYNWQPIHF